MNYISCFMDDRVIRILAFAAIALLTPAARALEICGEWNLVDPPAGAITAFTDVEARSATDAYALDPTWGLAHWDGTAWDEFPIPDIFGDYPIAWLDQITLVESSHLFLAGRGSNGPFSTDQLLKIWDGTSWSDWHSLTLQPNIGGAPRNGGATAVAGVAIDDVWIVGRSNGLGVGDGELPLTVHWDGSQLTEFITPGVADTQNPLFDAVAIATNDVWAVGHYFNVFNPPFGFRAATFHWDGSSWSPIPNPAEAFDDTHLYAVAAIAPDDVWAAGGDADSPLFIHWDGTDWTIVPAPATTGTIYGITAIASDDVWAVDFAAQVPVIGKFYHWDGFEWSIVLPPEIPGTTAVERHGGLAAVGECDVWAVGSQQVGPEVNPLIERLQRDITATPDVELPSLTGITQIAPNPFNPRVEIAFTLEKSGTALLTIHDLRGRIVRTLVQGVLEAGRHKTLWDAIDEQGLKMASGIYIVSLLSAGQRHTHKVVLLQ